MPAAAGTSMIWHVWRRLDTGRQSVPWIHASIPCAPRQLAGRENSMKSAIRRLALTAALLGLSTLACAEVQSYSAGVGSAAGEAYVPERLAAPPTPTPEQIARREAYLRMKPGHGPAEALPGALVSGPVARHATRLTMPDAQGGPEPQAPNAFRIFGNTALAPTTGSSDVNEPSHGNSGKHVFYVGNWYAAHSVNQGASWTYIDPYADFPDFCCDQDVVYDTGRDLMLWYRQGVFNGSSNNFKVGVSRNGGASWVQYTINYTNYGGLPQGWFDYPHLAVSNNYLYITSNYFNTDGTFQRMILTRMSLDQLRVGGGLSWSWWSRTTGWTWTPIQGARETMYLGDHTNSSMFNVCDQPEANAVLTCRDVAVPAWTWTPRGVASCTTPNGFNPCWRLDHRINAGYLRRSDSGTGAVLGFFWTVAQGSGFSFPYVNAVAMDPATFTPLAGAQSRPYIFNASLAFIYAGAAPNARGHLGLSTWIAGGGNYPTLYVGIDDDYNGAPPGWEIAFAAASTTLLADQRWGDYTRVRQHSPEANVWSASGHVTTSGGQSPRYVVFGREREEEGYVRFKLK